MSVTRKVSTKNDCIEFKKLGRDAADNNDVIMILPGNLAILLSHFPLFRRVKTITNLNLGLAKHLK